jgi:hypothetical protein
VASGAQPLRSRVLLITFYYPPGNESGTLRPLKLSKYLPDFGWDVSVLTVPPRCFESTDPALLQQIDPGTHTYRATCFDAKTAFGVRGRYPGFLAVPDRYASWLPFAVGRILRVLRRDAVHALLSTSPIPTAHMIGLVASMLTKVPWVADFRDPWGAELHGPLRRPVEFWLERQVALRAHRIIVTTPELGQYFRDRYGEAVGAKVAVVYNGYDEADFTEMPLEPGDTDSFEIVHSGDLYAGCRDPRPFLQAVRVCLDTGTLPRTTRVTFVGAGEFTETDAFTEVVTRCALQGVVRVVSRIPYREALTALGRASALLLLQGGDDFRMCIPNKAFEYLRVGRPILVAAPAGSATARFMEGFDGVFMADPRDLEEVARKLAAMFAAWKAGSRTIDRTQSGLARYSRRAAAGEVASLLDALDQHGSPRALLGRAQS